MRRFVGFDGKRLTRASSLVWGPPLARIRSRLLFFACAPRDPASAFVPLGSVDLDPIIGQ